MLSQARIAKITIGAATSLMMVGGIASAQQTAAPAAVAGPILKDAAPSFTLAGADRYGLLRTPVKLSDYRGRTVVLAFFFKARTKG